METLDDGWPEPRILGPRQSLPTGTVLFTQGGRGEALYVVHHGVVKLTRGEGGGRSLIVGLRWSGWLAGASAALVGQRHSFSAETLTPAVVSAVDPGRFLRILQEHVGAAMWVARLHAREFEELTVLLGEVAALPPAERLERFLARALAWSDLTSRCDGVKLDLSLKQREVAKAIGVAPSHLSRLYASLEARGLIRRVKGRILVPGTSALFRVAEDLAGMNPPRQGI